MANGIARGRPDDFTRLPGIIDDLRGGRPLLLRNYVPYSGDESVRTALSMVEMVASSGVPWEIILLFKFDGDDLTGWLELIRQVVLRFGKSLDSLQITGEPNLRGMPDSGDGSRPQIMRALQEGVLMARQTARLSGSTVSIGFNAVPTFHGAEDFWPRVRDFGDEFRASLDYVGLDFYPDVFGSPIALPQLPAAVETMLRQFRERDLAAGGIPASIPLRITENGWPTGPRRSDERQAEVLESIIRSVYSLRLDLNISHYELFALRDADSGNAISFYQFGIMRDNYDPKPAFDTYKRLIQELGGD